jgi:hypothetical protein
MVSGGCDLPPTLECPIVSDADARRMHIICAVHRKFGQSSTLERQIRQKRMKSIDRQFSKFLQADRLNSD